MFILIMLLQICMCFGSDAQDAQLFDQANRLYAQGAYGTALAEYQKIPNKTGSVWYNMANAAYQQQDYTQALLYWLRAQKYGDAATYAAAHAHLEQLAPVIGVPVQGVSNRTVYYGVLLIKKIPVYVWQILLLFCWYVLCRCWMKKYRCSATKLSMLSLLLLMMLVPIMIGYYTDKEQVLVVAESADLYNGPNSALYNVGSLQKNTTAVLLDAKKQWYKISHDAIIGWVERKSVAKI